MSNINYGEKNSHFILQGNSLREGRLGGMDFTGIRMHVGSYEECPTRGAFRMIDRAKVTYSMFVIKRMALSTSGWVGSVSRGRMRLEVPWTASGSASVIFNESPVTVSGSSNPGDWQAQNDHVFYTTRTPETFGLSFYFGPSTPNSWQMVEEVEVDTPSGKQNLRTYWRSCVVYCVFSQQNGALISYGSSAGTPDDGKATVLYRTIIQNKETKTWPDSFLDDPYALVWTTESDSAEITPPGFISDPEKLDRTLIPKTWGGSQVVIPTTQNSFGSEMGAFFSEVPADGNYMLAFNVGADNVWQIFADLSALINPACYEQFEVPGYWWYPWDEGDPVYEPGYTYQTIPFYFLEDQNGNLYTALISGANYIPPEENWMSWATITFQGIPLLDGCTLRVRIPYLGEETGVFTGNLFPSLVCRVYEYWPYQNSAGNPVFSSTTGQQINPIL